MNRPYDSGFDAIPTPEGEQESNAARPGANPIDCETAVRRLWDYLDGGLATPAHAEVEAHLATCADCPPHFAFAVATLDALAGASRDALTPEEIVALRARVRTALRHAAHE